MSPRESLAAAVREINLIFERCPAPQPDVFSSLTTAEAELDVAYAEGDREGALEVVAAWRFEALRLLSQRLVHAPLETSR